VRFAVRSVCIVPLLLSAVGPAAAATINVKHPENAAPVVVVTGEFEFSDIDAFSAAVDRLPSATVSFASEGGALLAGIRIGTLIREKRFATLVPDGAVCASACAVAWLGGANRFVGKGASVGFHAAYVLRAGVMAESGPGNAVLGAYLGRIGLSEEAIRYVTDAEPSTIHWMSMIEAAEHGITLAQWDADEPVGATEMPRRARKNTPEGSAGKHKHANDQRSLAHAGQSVRAFFAKLSKLNPIPRVRAATRPETPIPR
jgi:hypothetical protein